MRLLILTQHPTVVGGQETYLKYIAPALSKHGVDIAFAFGSKPQGSSSTDNYAAEFPHWELTNVARSLAWKPDAVYSNGIFDNRLELEYQDRFSCLFFAHGYHGACISGTRSHRRLGNRVCDFRFGTGCLLAYLPLGCGGLNPWTALEMYNNQTRISQHLTRYRSICVASRHMQQVYERQTQRKDFVKLLPLFPAGHRPMGKPPVRRSMAHRLLLCSRFTKVKGVDLVPEAVSLAQKSLGRSLELLIAGNGPEKTHFMAACRERKLTIADHGWLNAESLGALFGSVDLLLVPSVWPEPFGLIGIEAGCYGVPAVAFPVGGIVDWLTDGRNGHLASLPPKSIHLADAIQRALVNENHWHQLQLGAWGIAKQYDLDRHCQTLIAYLNDLI